MSKVYEQAGVSIEAGDNFVKRLKEFANSTSIPGVLGEIGFFGGLFELPKNMTEPVLVSGADGVGTKVKIAQILGKNDTIGIDCVAMNVDDIVCCGAKPLFLLDYLAVHELDEKISFEIIKGITEGCRLAKCALIGGETAQMTDIYKSGEYDLAGFAVGIVEKSKIINGTRIKIDDTIVGLPSSGLHSNGFTLARKVLEKHKLDSSFSGIPNLGLAMLEPTIIYTPNILKMIEMTDIHGLSHITGGGLFDNLPRIMKSGVSVIKRDKLPKIPIIDFVVKELGLDEIDSFRTFNMGIGMAVFVPECDVDTILSLYPNAVVIGHVEPSDEPSFKLI